MFRGLLMASMLLLCAPPSHAQSGPPDLKGSWRGNAQAVMIGTNPYRVPDAAGVNFPAAMIEFTLTFDRQEGNRFSGQSSGGRFKETLIGAIQADNKGGFILDDDGEYAFTLRDANTMDLCYRHSYPTSKIVTCYTATRTQ